MSAMVEILKNIKIIKGFKKKILSKKEINNLSNLRRSYYFRNNLNKGKIISSHDIKFVRPFVLNSINNENLILNKKLKYKVKKNSLITKKYF